MPGLASFRCFAEGSLTPGRVGLSSAEAHHLIQVRRVRVGEPVTVMNGRGQVGGGTLLDDGSVSVAGVTDMPRPRPGIVLLMAALKQTAWEEVLRHATELGVERIVRVETGHAVARVKGAKAERKLARWREILIEACKQSANPWLPGLSLAGSVREACDLPDLPETWWLAQLGEGVRPVGEPLREGIPDRLAVWIGPEGDFTPSEIEAIRGAGAEPVSLGRRILRAETAALSLLAALRLVGENGLQEIPDPGTAL